ncbi:hypothetical protein RhiirC2_799459 [Rhizophagus irregularis]|uniref:Uncharacterized protein n=1 Tax=Rhizophagus irregularis TaxID=588596 RepID=A0A2N1M527_9GLOM|nr:hypothetical protein RhiirC2_799459 [Rhizophagus irregularis]
MRNPDQKTLKELKYLLVKDYFNFINCNNLTKFGATIDVKNFPDLLLLLKSCRKLQILEIYGNYEQLDVNGILPELGLSLSHSFVVLIIGANWSFTHYNVTFMNTEAGLGRASVLLKKTA